MPAALMFPIGSKFYDWMYSSQPEPHMNGRRVSHGRGKILGGSSSINGMIFQRGNPLDYERWAADRGMETWSYAHCLPYFKKMETCLAGGDEWRGSSGPLVLERGPSENPLIPAFLDACQQAGYPLTSDVNGYQQEGFARFDRNVHRGRRLSAARAYLHPVKHRRNLKVITRALAHKVLFSGNRATGVQYEVRGKVLGIVGLGTIGKKVARLAQAFGMIVHYYDIKRLKEEEEDALGVRFRLLPEILRHADILSLHVPLNASTQGMIGAAELAVMKPSAIIVNTSRGPVIDEKAMTAALSAGKIGRAHV